MIDRRQFALLVVCCATAAAGLDGACGTLLAQNLRPALGDDGPLRPVRPRAAPRVQPPEPADAEPTAPVGPGRPRAPVAEAPAGDDVPAADRDPDAEGVPSGLRPATRDGDLDIQLEPEPVTDGVAADAEDYRNPDGADPVAWDSRLPEDSDAFERPPAGHDSQAFGVEIDPLSDRRPYRLFLLEPWEPRGIRVGSYTLFPTIDLGAAWLSNLFRSKPARADAALELRPTLRLVSNRRMHAVELRATGGYTFFDEFPKENDTAYAIEARGRLDVTRRTQVAASILRDVAQETRGTLESRLRGGARADVTTDESRLTFDHRFNRLAVQLRGSYQQRTYEDVVGADATTTSNRDRNLEATEEAARVSWTFKPTLLAFAEAGLNQRRFEAAAADGIRRDSDGERYRVGVGFGNTGQVLRGEASIGFGRQAPLDMRLSAIDGVIIDANLSWRINALTALLLRGSTDVTETTTPLSAGGFTHRAQAELRHAFLRPLIGTARVGYAATSYQGIGLSESLAELALGIEYYLAPEAVLFGRYQHSIFRTNAASAEWDADEVRVGLRLRR